MCRSFFVCLSYELSEAFGLYECGLDSLLKFTWWLRAGSCNMRCVKKSRGFTAHEKIAVPRVEAES